MTSSTAYQLDLFGALPPALQRQRDTLVCLRDAMPHTLEIVANLDRAQPIDNRSTGYGGGWAYSTVTTGLRVEPAQGWFSRQPKHLVPWTELAGLIGNDPRRTEIAAWANSLPLPRWKLLIRPYELWPNPHRWHPGYLCRDHLHTQWPTRRRTWQLVIDLLNDALARVDTAQTA